MLQLYSNSRPIAAVMTRIKAELGREDDTKINYEWLSLRPALRMPALDIHNCLELNLIFQDYILENTSGNSLLLAVAQANIAHLG